MAAAAYYYPVEIISAEEREMLKTLHNGAHNTAVDQEQAVADQLNEQVRVFKAKHPGP